jgi:serine phosphatase RsbU (regulator of sigma subunit)
VIIPAVACQLRVIARRIPLGAGGDIHDALITPFGVRLMIGDVMGSGLPANETGRQVLAAWRELAVTEPSLPRIAMGLHALISRSENPERFVTALLATFGGQVRGQGVEMVCCGHPPPLLLRGKTASLADGWCTATTVPFGDGDGLLLYTDGASEARDTDGRYFPLSERTAEALQAVRSPDGEHMLDSLVRGLRAHIGENQADDILLLLVNR